MTSLRLFAITALEDDSPGSPAPGVQVVAFRDLDAIVAPAPYEVASRDVHDVELHRDVIASLFTRFPVLPAPYGVAFESDHVLQRWLEVHYYTLSDALRFVEDRIGARLYVSERETLLDSEITAGKTDVPAISTEVFRVLRHHSVASSTLRASNGGGQRTAGTFLVERDSWPAFSSVVAEESRRHPSLLFRLTGPWPPYDFVRLQFGG